METYPILLTTVIYSQYNSLDSSMRISYMTRVLDVCFDGIYNDVETNGARGEHINAGTRV